MSFCSEAQEFLFGALADSQGCMLENPESGIPAISGGIAYEANFGTM